MYEVFKNIRLSDCGFLFKNNDLTTVIPLLLESNIYNYKSMI